MIGDNHHPPGLTNLFRKLGTTVLGAVENRGELLAVEWHEERVRMAELLVRTLALFFITMMAVMLLTATIIFLFPEGARLYVAAAFILLYMFGAVGVWFGLRPLLREAPFAESLNQLKQDRAWLDSLK